MEFRECKQGDPHCPVNYGEECESDCYKMLVDTAKYERLLNIERMARIVLIFHGKPEFEKALDTLRTEITKTDED